MNRQLRRANEKSEKKKEKEKMRRKRERRAAKTERTKKRAERPAVQPGDRTSRTGRFAPVWIVFTVAIILFKELFPAFGGPEAAAMSGTADLLFDTLYFALLGYFVCLWLLRRGLMQALSVTVAAGMVLAVAVEAAKLALPELEPVYLALALALPALLLGGMLGRLVYRKAR